MSQIDVKALPIASITLVDDNIMISPPESLTKSQQMVGLSGPLDKGGHSHKPSSASNIESEISH